MTKEERRIRDFSSGMKNLDDEGRSYIHRLTNILFLVEKPPVCPVVEINNTKSKKKMVFPDY